MHIYVFICIYKRYTMPLSYNMLLYQGIMQVWLFLFGGTKLPCILQLNSLKADPDKCTAEIEKLKKAQAELEVCRVRPRKIVLLLFHICLD